MNTSGRHVHDTQRVRPRGDHVLPRGSSVSGGVRHRGDQAGKHRDRDPDPGRHRAGGGEAHAVSAHDPVEPGQDHGDRRPRGVRGERADRRRAEHGRARTGAGAEPLLHLQREHAGSVADAVPLRPQRQLRDGRRGQHVPTLRRRAPRRGPRRRQRLPAVPHRPVRHLDRVQGEGDWKRQRGGADHAAGGVQGRHDLEGG